MGEAKRRGTYEERKAEGIIKRKAELDQAILMLEARNKEFSDLENMTIEDYSQMAGLVTVLEKLKTYRDITYGA